MPNKPHLTNNGMPCPRCQQSQGYIQQTQYYKDFYCPVCLYQCPAKHYRTRQKEATTSTQPHDPTSNQSTNEQATLLP